VIELVEYITRTGACPFLTWRLKLDPSVRVRVVTATSRLGEGNFSAVKGVGAGVFELRIDFGPGYRVYFGKDGEQLVILLGGGTKHRQQGDIASAQRLWSEYKDGRKTLS
jgi:putative addiction module killer protein